MIEINLLPGAGKRSRGRGASAASLGGSVSEAFAKVKDPSLIVAVLGVVLAVAGVAAMFLQQSRREEGLLEAEARAVQDSTRFAAVIRDRRLAEAQRDSVVRQINIIRSIDGERFVWPHIMDEVSRAMPPFTWLTSIAQTSAAPTAAGPAPSEGGQPAAADTTEAAGNMKFRVVGNTVDIQALTRFMRFLESSPFIQNVQLARSEVVLVEGKEVTEFQLDAEWERPDSSAIRTVPVSLAVR
jgi:Tfp pilus assembly protein PilN